MRVTVKWDDEARTILRYTYTEKWAWADYETAIKHAAELHAQTNLPMLDVIADFSDSTLLPQNAISNFQRSMNQKNSLPFGVTVLVTKSQFILRMIDLYGKMNRRSQNRIRTAKDVDEARAIIAQIRITRISTTEEDSSA